MKTRLFIVLVCSFLMVGLSSTVMAATADDTGDSCVATVDIEEANLEIYDEHGQTNSPQKAKLYLKMADGSHLPGLMIWDVDYDQDLNTGIDMSVLNMPFTAHQCSGTGGEPATQGPWHSGEGIDFYIVVALRTQQDTGSSANCGGCAGGPNCAIADTNCTGGGNCATYFDPITSCDIMSTDPLCKEVAPPYEDCNEGRCYPMTADCDPNRNCAEPMYKGEWRAQIIAGSGSRARGDHDGDDIGLTWTITEENEVCFELQLHKVLVRTGGEVGYDSTHTGPPNYVVSAWYEDGAWDGDDFFSNGLELDMVDYMPNGENDYATGTRTPGPDCVGNYNADRSVLGDDIVGNSPPTPLDPVGFLDELSKRTQLSNKCPACD